MLHAALWPYFPGFVGAEKVFSWSLKSILHAKMSGKNSQLNLAAHTIAWERGVRLHAPSYGNGILTLRRGTSYECALNAALWPCFPGLGGTEKAFYGL